MLPIQKLYFGILTLIRAKSPRGPNKLDQTRNLLGIQPLYAEKSAVEQKRRASTISPGSFSIN